MERCNFELLHKMLGAAESDPQGMVGVGIAEQSGTKWFFFWACNPRPFRDAFQFFPLKTR